MPSESIIAKMSDYEHLFDNASESFMRSALQKMLNTLMELEAQAEAGAAKNERTPKRKRNFNGTRGRKLATGVGELELRIPKFRNGESYYPSFLDPRRMVDKALVNVIQEAYVNGVSTRKVDRLVEEMGIRVDKSAVSRMCKELSRNVEAFRNRPIEGEYPYIWLDATFPKVREGGRVAGMAFMVATGVNMDGERVILGFDVGTSETGEHWKEFLGGLVSRGLSGIQLVISDAHAGLRKAISETIPGAAWQRCRVHFMRNCLCNVPRKQQGMVSAMIRTIFTQETKEAARKQLRSVVTQLEKHYPAAMRVLEEAEEDILAYMEFPNAHHSQIHSTNPLERLNKEIRRRSNVVSIFPNRESLVRLIGSVLMEQQDEWLAAGKRYMSLESMQKLRYSKPCTPGLSA